MKIPEFNSSRMMVSEFFYMKSHKTKKSKTPISNIKSCLDNGGRNVTVANEAFFYHGIKLAEIVLTIKYESSYCGEITIKLDSQKTSLFVKRPI